MENVKFPYFKGTIHNIYPEGEISLKRFISSQQNPKDKLKEVFNQISECEKVGDDKKKAELKQRNLFYFTPCVKLEYRSYEGIRGFTGLLALDFDHIDRAEDFRDFLFERFDFIVCAYVSPSKAGVKALVKIPVVESVEQFKSYFYGLAYFMERFKGFDSTAQNPTLPLFVSWDEDIKWRNNATTWRGRGEQINKFEVYEGVIEEVENVTSDEKNRIYSIAKGHLEKANYDACGHPKVLAMGTVIGGYVASGYLTLEEGDFIMSSLIEKIDYYQKNVEGYKRTAFNMIRRGMSSPLYLSDFEDESK